MKPELCPEFLRAPAGDFNIMFVCQLDRQAAVRTNARGLDPIQIQDLAAVRTKESFRVELLFHGVQ